MRGDEKGQSAQLIKNVLIHLNNNESDFISSNGNANNREIAARI